MIIIPEKEIVLITPPRTGSTTLRQMVGAYYPGAFMPYRHMEASGVPFGYDRWRRIGIYREPIARLFSLYNYCRMIYRSDRGTAGWRNKMHLATMGGFEDWLVTNEVVFTDPFDSEGQKYWPKYAVQAPVPENRKSLFTYIRPDLGTEVWHLQQALDYLGLHTTSRMNTSGAFTPPTFDELGPAAKVHMRRFHLWDLGTSIINEQE